MGDLKYRIKERRRSANLTQQELSKMLDVSFMTIRRWESGEVSPRIDEIEKLAKVLNTSVEYLMGLDLNKTQNAPTIQNDPEFSIKEKDLISLGKVLYYENNGKRFILPATPENEKWFREMVSKDL